MVVIALLLQPVFGFIHHWRFLKKQRRGKWTILHVWYGRLLIILGMVNGGLGLHLASDGQAYSKAGMIAYAVLAGISGITFLSVAAFASTMKEKKDVAEMTQPVRA